MVTLTDDVRTAYEDYVRKVRAYLTSAGTANPDDVLADLREHVDQELKAAGEPVSRQAMQAILDRLGSPQQWISTEELSWWRKTLLRVRTGPDGWRLAYASFGVLLLGILLGWVFSDTWRGEHEFNRTIMTVFTGLSFILSRAAVAAAGRTLGSAQKWLVYPSLVIVYVFLAAAIIIWAPIAGGMGGFCVSYDSLEQHHAGAPTPGYYPLPFSSFGLQSAQTGALDVRAGIFAAWAATAAAGAWWSILAVLLLFDGPRKLVATIFAPFLAVIRKRWAVAGLVLGLVLLLLAVVSAYAASQWGHVYF